MRRIVPMLVFFLLFALVVPSPAQQAQTSQAKESAATDRERTASLVVSPGVSVLDGPLDVESYIVGAGDVFAVAVGTSPPILLTVTVSADGILLLPPGGEVQASGKTLAQVRKDAVAKLQSTFLRAPVTLALTTPRSIRVRATGTAVNEGTYRLTAADRVSSLLSEPLVRREVSASTGVAGREAGELMPFSRRSIIIRHANLGRTDVDLDRYSASGDSRWNPHLVEGDEVIVRVLDASIPCVAVGGMVEVPGSYEFVEGDRLVDLLAYARGIRMGARTDSVLLYRSSDPARVLRLPGDSSVALAGGDRVWVPGSHSATQVGLVEVVGEVRWPGWYPVGMDAVRLSDLIRTAGGLTERANAAGASMTRRSVSPSERGLQALAAMRGNTAAEDSQYVRQETQLRLTGEQVRTDLTLAMSRPGTVDDPVVRPGDRLFVPRLTGTVYVFGQVAHPGLQPFSAGASVKEYLRAAGGVTDRAKSGDVMVIKQATRQWLEPSETTVEDGDAIWVPKVVERDLATDLAPYVQIAGILSSVATLILLVTQLSK